MKVGLKILRLFAVVACVQAAIVLPAHAIPLVYDIASFSDGGFSASWIHGASSKQTKDGVDYYPGGTKYLSLSGIIEGDYDVGADIFTVSGGTLSATGVSAGNGFSGTWSVLIGLGTLIGTTPTASGTLAYQILKPDSSVYDAGSFHFAPVNFGGAPQTLDTSTLALWGNNWDNSAMSRQAFINAGGIPLGMDIYGTGRTVPEPATLLILGFALLLISVTRPVTRGHAFRRL